MSSCCRSNKNYSLLIEAAALVVGEMVKRGRRPKFLIADGGPNVAQLSDPVRANDLEVSMESFETTDDIAGLMAEADTLVRNALWEGLPITQIDAASSGMTIVGGNGENVLRSV